MRQFPQGPAHLRLFKKLERVIYEEPGRRNYCYWKVGDLFPIRRKNMIGIENAANLSDRSG